MRSRAGQARRARRGAIGRAEGRSIRLLLCGFCVAAFSSATAHAQGFVERAEADRPAEELQETLFRMRFDVTAGAFVESQLGEAPVENTSIASPNSIYWLDLRAKVDARHIQGSRVDGMIDMRARLNPDPSAPSRGYRGGEEYDLKEGHFTWRGETTNVALGRQILRDVDAQTIDGLTVVQELSKRYELGAFAGLYPDPFSRSIYDDYKVTVYSDEGLPIGSEYVRPLPVAAGGWTGYRYSRAHGALGAAAILPRNDDPPLGMPMAPPRSENRVLLTSHGYWRTLQSVDVIHYVVAEGRTKSSLPTLVNGQLILHWRPSDRVLLEAGASRMSSYAVEVYLRDLLERLHPYVGMCPDMTTRCVQNNLEVIRIASSEVRAGGNYLFAGPRVDVHAQLRYREREGLAVPEGLLVFNADTQYDVSVGLRKKRAIGGFDVGASAVAIRGERTAANMVGLRASRALQGSLFLDLDAGYSQYEDGCVASMLDPRTCDGTARGYTYKGGVLGTWQRDLHWLVIADYHLNVNKAQAIRNGLVNSYPYFAGHSFFLRVQYRQ
jgi:hypothetical protein